MKRNLRHRPRRKSRVAGTVAVIASSACLLFVFYWCLKFTYLKGYSAGLDAGVDMALETFDSVRQVELPEPVIPINISFYVPIYNEIFIGNDTLASQNKNPMNIKARTNDPWVGQVGADSAGHAIFESYEHGIRAAAFALRSYAVTHGINTVHGIVQRFAEGNREAYIEFLCSRLRVSPHQKIDIIARMPELLRAMSKFESGMDLPDKYFIAYDIVTKPLTRVQD